MLQRTFGAKVKPCAVWDADQCRTREPALRDSRASIVGGIWWEDNESGDCNMFTARLADTCRSKYGVTFLFDTGVSLLMRDPANPHRVRALLTDEGREVEVDRVVVCLGSYTPLLLRRSLDVWLPIFPVKGYSLTLRPDDAPLTSGGHDAAPSLNIADIESKTYIARFGGILGDRLRVVGMGELCGYDQNVDPAKEGVTNLTAVVGQLFPRLPSSASREASLWACLRPMTPYTPPLAGPRIHVCRVCRVCCVWVGTQLGAGARQGLVADHRAGGANGERLRQLGPREHGLDAGLRVGQARGCTRFGHPHRPRSHTLRPSTLFVGQENKINKEINMNFIVSTQTYSLMRGTAEQAARTQPELVQLSRHGERGWHIHCVGHADWLGESKSHQISNPSRHRCWSVCWSCLLPPTPTVAGYVLLLHHLHRLYSF
jgi:hypothetical protein